MCSLLLKFFNLKLSKEKAQVLESLLKVPSSSFCIPWRHAHYVTSFVHFFYTTLDLGRDPCLLGYIAATRQSQNEISQLRSAAFVWRAVSSTEIRQVSWGFFIALGEGRKNRTWMELRTEEVMVMACEKKELDETRSTNAPKPKPRGRL